MDLAKVEVSISTHKNDVYTLCFSPDQTILCSAGYEFDVVLTNLQNYAIKNTLIAHESSVYGSDFSSNGEYFATASADRVILIWNSGGENKNIAKLEGHIDWVFCVRYQHNDPTRVISGSKDAMIKIWDIERMKDISTLAGCEGIVYSVDILPNNQTIASGEEYDKLRIWDIRRRNCVHVLDDHKDSIYSVQFHPNMFSLASGSSDHTIKIFDIRTFKLLHSYEEHSNSVNSIYFHPSGKLILSGSRDKTVKITDLSNRKVLCTFSEHPDCVTNVQFSPDGKHFATACEGNVVLYWSFPLGRVFGVLEKDTDEDERVNYLVQKDLLLLLENHNDNESYFCERKVLQIRIDGFLTLYCYKFFFVEKKLRKK